MKVVFNITYITYLDIYKHTLKLMIKLHPQLEKDCICLGEFSLCSLLLLNDSHFPWFILVPNREGISEIYQLAPQDQQQLLAESMFFCQCLEEIFQPDKLNIAALGNIVPQLHVHHIARFKTDACWPAPVWGVVKATPYTASQLDNLKIQIRNRLKQNSKQPFHWF